MELSQHLHLFIAIVSTYLFLIFSWWWYVSGGSSHIYKITCFLMLGLTFTHFGAWYLYCLNTKNDEVVLFLSQWWWPWRQLFVLIPLIWYAVHVTKKSCKGRKFFRSIGDL